MTFLEALKTGKPMRQKAVGLNENHWLWLGSTDSRLGLTRPCWRSMETGEIVTFARYEYLADDWEVLVDEPKPEIAKSTADPGSF
jgi:hypothetical protein